MPYVTHEPMLGRPNCGEPVLTKTFAGPWLKTLVAIERTMVRLSTTAAVCGRHSDTQVPCLPWRANLRTVASSLGFSLVKLSMKAKRLPLMNSSGIGLLWSVWSFGLWPDSPSGLGPAAMEVQETAFDGVVK